MSHRVRSTPDLAYARVEGTELFLDLHRPELDREVPVVACFHGGGWQRGSRKDMVSERLLPFAAQGVAVASVGYRFIDAATYPAQLHDGKAAVRWLRAHAGEFGLLGDRIGAWGASAGGWIALMLALTGGEPEFDGGVGADAGLDSSVNAAAAWFPITNLATLASERETAGLTLPPFLQGRPAPDMAAALLAVADVAEDPVTAQVASP
ncbi:MAG TPA: alpha/beta hydrolase, partial [Solirubrobacteraceae bacterium]|nr:alpha/beta hydrolase [Solirubrobacteraceae bacterium]